MSQVTNNALDLILDEVKIVACHHNRNIVTSFGVYFMDNNVGKHSYDCTYGDCQCVCFLFVFFYFGKAEMDKQLFCAAKEGKTAEVRRLLGPARGGGTTTLRCMRRQQLVILTWSAH